MGIEARLQRPRGGGHQHPVLGPEPGQGLPGGTDVLRLRARLGRGQRDRPAGGMQPQRRGVGRVQVMIEHPAGGRAPLGLAVGRLRQLGGVGAEQVVAPEPAARMLGQQVALVSSPSLRRPSSSGRAARLAAAAALMSGPGCSPSSRNSRAAGASS